MACSSWLLSVDRESAIMLVPSASDMPGPRGGKAHNPGEYVLADSLLSRAQVALAVAGAALRSR